MNKQRRRIVEALEHYRCPGCDAEANFTHHEVSLSTWTYSAKKDRWVFAGVDPIEDHGGMSADIIDDCHRVHCRNCVTPILWPDRSFVKDIGDGGLDDWLEILADEWESQKVERDKAAAELEEAKQSLNPPGYLAQLEARLKRLNTIRRLKGQDPNDPDVQASQAEGQARLEAAQQEYQELFQEIDQ